MTAVLVTGGAGYVGSHACKALARAGYVPVTFDNLSEGHRWAVKWGPFELGDLSDVEAIRKVMRRHKVRAVMHFGASSRVGESVRDPVRYFRNNMANSLNLFEAMADCGVEAVVFSSSAACYGTPSRVPIDEDHPQLPMNPYGESKKAVEGMLRWFADAHGIRWIAFRYFNAAGADPEGEIGEQHDPETHLIPLALMTALHQRPWLDLFGTDYPTQDGTAVRDYVHVSDLAEAHVRGLHHLMDGGRSGAFNLGTGRGYSVRAVIRAVEEVCGTPLTVREGPRRPGDPPILVADPRRSDQVLGWRPAQSDLLAIVSSAWTWHSRQSNIAPIQYSRMSSR